LNFEKGSGIPGPFFCLAFFFEPEKHQSMKLYLKALLVTCVGAAILGILFWKWSQATVSMAPTKITQIGEMETAGMPNFKLATLEGKAVEFKDFQNQVVIVSFWASWCGPCLEEFPSMIELVEKMNGKVKLLAVSQDSSKAEIEAFLKSFPKSNNPNIYILWDEKHEVGQQYNADRLPETFVAGKDQKLVRKIVGSINWATPDAIRFMEELTRK
jgi:thiol-disulfide isomerase/thioredoxin